MRKLVLPFVFAALLASAAGTVHAAPPFDLTLGGPATFYPGRTLDGPFTGALTVAGVGVPNQTIEVRVDGALVATAATTVQGAYAVSLPPFSGTADRVVTAIAASGTPFETVASHTVEVVRYDLEVSVGGAGTGRVLSDPAGIDCPNVACTVSFPATAEVRLDPVSDPNSAFAGWSGAPCTGSLASCTVVMDSDIAVGATFAPDLRRLTVNRLGAGSGIVTSSPAGITCGIDCTEDYAIGTVVTLTASPASGSVFSGWSGGGCSGTGSCVVSMTAAATVGAAFSPQFFTLSVSRAGFGNGTVVSSPAGINCGVDCSEIYASGATIVLTASPSFGSSFAGWSGACVGTGSCVVSMTSNKSVVATFS